MFVLLFWARWYPECELIKHKMNLLVDALSQLVMGWCDVDSDRDIV